MRKALASARDEAFTKSETTSGCDPAGDLAAIDATTSTLVTTVSTRPACPCP